MGIIVFGIMSVSRFWELDLDDFEVGRGDVQGSRNSSSSKGLDLPRSMGIVLGIVKVLLRGI